MRIIRKGSHSGNLDLQVILLGASGFFKILTKVRCLDPSKAPPCFRASVVEFFSWGRGTQDRRGVIRNRMRNIWIVSLAARAALSARVPLLAGPSGPATRRTTQP